jgi:hypothetical protein
MSDAGAWVTSSCADLGLVVTSSGERTHDQPWSYAVTYDVREVDGTDGQVWLKANGIGTRHEPRLISALSSLVPDLVPEVLAIDGERGWSLTRDVGPTWRSAVSLADQWPLWEDLVARYAAAQLALAPHLTELLATGVPERSPATLPHQAATLIAELTQYGTDGTDSGGLSEVESQALTARLPAYGQCCRELDGAGIPWTIQHDDLHANNICLVRAANDRVTDPTAVRRRTSAAGSRIVDWGDASIGHPFGTMLTALRSIAHHARCAADDPRILRVRDAYLEPFTTYGSRSQLITAVDVASRVGTVTRALSWRAALLGVPTTAQREYDYPVRGWLQEMLAD